MGELLSGYAPDLPKRTTRRSERLRLILVIQKGELQ
nr:MAG TPA: hypothetical protein [Caudoviricetes sp.]